MCETSAFSGTAGYENQFDSLGTFTYEIWQPAQLLSWRCPLAVSVILRSLVTDGMPAITISMFLEFQSLFDLVSLCVACRFLSDSDLACSENVQRVVALVEG